MKVQQSEMHMNSVEGAGVVAPLRPFHDGQETLVLCTMRVVDVGVVGWGVEVVLGFVLHPLTLLEAREELGLWPGFEAVSSWDVWACGPEELSV